MEERAKLQSSSWPSEFILCIKKDIRRLWGISRPKKANVESVIQGCPWTTLQSFPLINFWGGIMETVSFASPQVRSFIIPSTYLIRHSTTPSVCLDMNTKAALLSDLAGKLALINLPLKYVTSPTNMTSFRLDPKKVPDINLFSKQRRTHHLSFPLAVALRNWTSVRKFGKDVCLLQSRDWWEPLWWGALWSESQGHTGHHAETM